MANKTCKLYIRSKVGVTKPGWSRKEGVHQAPDPRRVTLSCTGPNQPIPLPPHNTRSSVPCSIHRRG